MAANTAGGEGERRGLARTLGDAASARLSTLTAGPLVPVTPPEPLIDGDPERAAALAAGRIRFAGAEITVRGTPPFGVRPPSQDWARALYSFGWLYDAVSGRRADRAALRLWVRAWLLRGGLRAGWADPLTTAQRLGALVSCWPMAAAGLEPPMARRLAKAVGAHIAHLDRRWRAHPDRAVRLEAAAALAAAAAATRAPEAKAARAARAVAHAAEALIDGDGGVPGRDPAALTRAVAVTAWAAGALSESGTPPEPGHLAALARASAALRALRLGDGRPPAAHGGGRASRQALDAALAHAGLAAPARGGRRERAMGFVRVTAARAVLLIDAAPPPRGSKASASTLAVSLSHGRTRVLDAVRANAAPNSPATLAARATAAHCAVEVAGASCARYARSARRGGGGAPVFTAGPRMVTLEQVSDLDAAWVQAAHDGYLAGFGVIVGRRLRLTHDGLDLRGEDTLSCPDDAARRRFDAVRRGAPLPFVSRFHLPAGAVAAADGAHVRIDLPDGAAWRIEVDGGALTVGAPAMASGPDATLEAGPVVALAGAAENYWGRITWRLWRDPPPPRRG